MKQIKVIGIAVCDSETHFRNEIARLVEEFNVKFNMNYKIGEYEVIKPQLYNNNSFCS